MRTLIIHPEDQSTSFVRKVYEDLPDKLVINRGLTQEGLRDIVSQHDKIVMIGHGNPDGLFSVGAFIAQGFIIDETFVDILSTKKECMYLWCNADRFVEKHNLSGFYSGMFISELYEAEFCGVDNPTEEKMDCANQHFQNVFGKYLHGDMEYIYENVKKDYAVASKDNSIIDYNSKRIYYK
jgi:cobalamin biosynthesis Co2+ chelatase CbiK